MTIESVGRNVIAVIGIDRYAHWRPLANAVRDATGAAALFQELGFEEAAPPLLDERATGKAIETLVKDDLRRLEPEDSLVLFYAGHGGTRKHRVGNQTIKTGFLIPVDASDSPDQVATWVDLEAWLKAVSLLPAKHILVVLDACHSGIALDPVIKWRDIGTWKNTPLSALNARRSRRIITSALDDEVALDSGPVHGHSLFTGCLIEGLTHGLRPADSRVTTGSALGLYVQQRVKAYPNSRQTPDFGTFALDDRGEMVIPLVVERSHANEAIVDSAQRDVSRRDSTPALSVGSDPVGEARAAAPARYVEPASAARPTDGLPVSMAPKPVERLIALVPRDRRWRRRGVVASGVALGLALIGYRVRGGEPSTAQQLIDAPPDATVDDAFAVGATTETGREPAPGVCPEAMVPVPAGTFQMGGPDDNGDVDAAPHTVTLSSYCIDMTEVTVKAYSECVASKGCSAVTVAFEDCNRADHFDYPINCVDWNQATAYCTWADKRLPTEAEWEYAARGSDGRIYPWGNEQPTAERLSFKFNSTGPVGKLPKGASPFGALDMAGNVLEWTSDWYGAYSAGPGTNPLGPKTGSYRVIRGGGWNLFDATHVRAANRDRGIASLRSSRVGLRCVRGD